MKFAKHKHRYLSVEKFRNPVKETVDFKFARLRATLLLKCLRAKEIRVKISLTITVITAASCHSIQV